PPRALYSSPTRRSSDLGRSGQRSIALYVAGDDPMDTHLVNHPQAVFDLAVEDNVIDAQNPHILSAHLCAAAAEIPLRPDDLDDLDRKSTRLNSSHVSIS